MGDFFDKFSKVPLSQKILLLFLVLGAIFLGFYMFLFKTIEEDIIRQQEVQAQLSSDRAQLDDLREEVAFLENAVDEEQNLRRLFQFDLPTQDNIPDLLDEIHGTATEIPTLTIREVRRLPYVPANEYTIIPIELRLSASFNQLIDFCWSLARMSRIVHVKEVTMRPTGGSATAAPGGPPLLDINLRIQAFFRPEG